MKKTSINFPPYHLTTISFLLIVLLFSNGAIAQSNHEGIYASKKDTVIFNEMNNDYLSYFNTRSGRIGTLLKNNTGMYFLGNMNQRPDSSKKIYSASLQFENNNQKLIFKDSTGKLTDFKKTACLVKYVPIKTGDGVILNAKLVIPQTGHKVPLIIVAQGSEQVSNDFYKESYLFASWGVATLVFDKRGVGKSGGKPEPDIFLQAEDVSAAARMAATLLEIDAQKIGVWGFSQGGWVTPLAIIHQPIIHFSIILSGPATTALEEEIVGIRKSLLFFGFQKNEIENATSLVTEIYLTVQHPENWQNLDTLKERFKNEKWYPVMIKQSLICSYFLGPNADYVKSHFNDLVASNSYSHWCFYDPSRYIGRVHIPVLWLYGSEDKSIPVEESIAILQNVKTNLQSPFTIKLLKGVNHAGYIDKHTGVEDYDHVSYISPEYLQTMKNWLKSNRIM